MTAAIGMPKIAPVMPAILEPMSTEPRTTMGWIPTAPAMTRGWSTFITRNQPTPITMIAGSVALGWTRIATSDVVNRPLMRLPASRALWAGFVRPIVEERVVDRRTLIVSGLVTMAAGAARAQ